MSFSCTDPDSCPYSSKHLLIKYTGCYDALPSSNLFVYHIFFMFMALIFVLKSKDGRCFTKLGLLHNLSVAQM